MPAYEAVRLSAQIQVRKSARHRTLDVTLNEGVGFALELASAQWVFDGAHMSSAATAAALTCASSAASAPTSAPICAPAWSEVASSFAAASLASGGISAAIAVTSASGSPPPSVSALTSVLASVQRRRQRHHIRPSPHHPRGARRVLRLLRVRGPPRQRVGLGAQLRRLLGGAGGRHRGHLCGRPPRVPPPSRASSRRAPRRKQTSWQGLVAYRWKPPSARFAAVKRIVLATLVYHRLRAAWAFAGGKIQSDAGDPWGHGSPCASSRLGVVGSRHLFRLRGFGPRPL